jgi:hypothetical protein
MDKDKFKQFRSLPEEERDSLILEEMQSAEAVNKLLEQRDITYERLNSELKNAKNEKEKAGINIELSELIFLERRLIKLGKRYFDKASSGSLSKREELSLEKARSQAYTNLRQFLYSIDTAESTISSIESSNLEDANGLVDIALSENKEEQQFPESEIAMAQSQIDFAIRAQVGLQSQYFEAPFMRFYTDRMYDALKINVDYLLTIIKGKKNPLLRSANYSEKDLNDPMKLPKRELDRLKKPLLLNADPQSLRGAVKLLHNRVTEAHEFMIMTADMRGLFEEYGSIRGFYSQAVLTGNPPENSLIDDSIDYAKDTFNGLNFHKQINSDFHYKLPVFARFGFKPEDVDAYKRDHDRWVKDMETLKSVEFKTYIEVLSEYGPKLSDEKLIKMYKKLDSTFKMSNEKLIEKFGFFVGRKLVELMFNIKDELISRDLGEKLKNGTIDITSLDELRNTQSNAITEIEASDYPNYGDVQKLSETSENYLIIVNDGPLFRLILTKKYEEDQKEFNSLSDSQKEALTAITSVVMHFNSIKKLVSEDYLAETLESSPSIKALYEANALEARGDFSNAKKKYLKCIKLARKDKRVDSMQLKEAKNALKLLAKEDIKKIFGQLDPLITSIKFNVYQKKDFAGSLNQASEVLKYVESQKNALRLATEILNQDNNVYTLDDALDVVVGLYRDFRSTEARVKHLQKKYGFVDATFLKLFVEGKVAPRKDEDFDRNWHTQASPETWVNGARADYKEMNIIRLMGKEKTFNSTIRIAKWCSKNNLYHAGEHFYKKHLSGFIGSFKTGKFEYSQFYKDCVGPRWSEEISEDVDEKVRDYMESIDSNGMPDYLKELFDSDVVTPEVEEYLRNKLTDQVINETYESELYALITKEAKIYMDPYRKPGTTSMLEEMDPRWSNDMIRKWLKFNEKYKESDKEWYEFWRMTDQDRNEFLTGLVFEIPMLAATGGAAGLIGRQGTMWAAKKMAVRELMKLSIKKAFEKGGFKALRRIAYSRGTGFLAETVVFSEMSFAHGSLSSGDIDSFFTLKGQTSSLGHSLVTLGVLKTTGAGLHKLGLDKTYGAQYGITPIVDTVALTGTQYMLEGGDLDMATAIRSNLAISFGLRLGHGLAGLRSSITEKGKFIESQRGETIAEDISPNLKATKATEGEGFYRSRRSEVMQKNVISDYLNSGETFVGGKPIKGMTLDEAYNVARFSAKNQITPEFWTSRCKNSTERLAVIDKLNSLRKGTISAEKLLESFNSDNTGRIVVELLAQHPSIRIRGEARNALDYIAKNSEAAHKLFEGMNSNKAVDLLQLLSKFKVPAEIAEAKCKTIDSKNDLLHRLTEWDSRLKKAGKRSMRKNIEGAEELFMAEFKSGQTGRLVAEILSRRPGFDLRLKIADVETVIGNPESFDLGRKLLLKRLKSNPKDLELISDRFMEVIKKLDERIAKIQERVEAGDPAAIAELKKIMESELESTEYNLLSAFLDIAPELGKDIMARIRAKMENLELKSNPGYLGDIVGIIFSVKGAIVGAWGLIIVKAWRSRVPIKKMKDHGKTMTDMFNKMVSEGILSESEEALNAKIDARVKELMEYKQALKDWETAGKNPRNEPKRPSFLDPVDRNIVEDGGAMDIRFLAEESLDGAGENARLIEEIRTVSDRLAAIHKYINAVKNSQTVQGSKVPERPNYLTVENERDLLTSNEDLDVIKIIKESILADRVTEIKQYITDLEGPGPNPDRPSYLSEAQETRLKQDVDSSVDAIAKKSLEKDSYYNLPDKLLLVLASDPESHADLLSPTEIPDIDVLKEFIELIKLRNFTKVEGLEEAGKMYEMSDVEKLLSPKIKSLDKARKKFVNARKLLMDSLARYNKSKTLNQRLIDKASKNLEDTFEAYSEQKELFEKELGDILKILEETFSKPDDYLDATGRLVVNAWPMVKWFYTWKATGEGMKTRTKAFKGAISLGLLAYSASFFSDIVTQTINNLKSFTGFETDEEKLKRIVAEKETILEHYDKLTDKSSIKDYETNDLSENAQNLVRNLIALEKAKADKTLQDVSTEGWEPEAQLLLDAAKDVVRKKDLKKETDNQDDLNEEQAANHEKDIEDVASEGGSIGAKETEGLNPEQHARSSEIVTLARKTLTELPKSLKTTSYAENLRKSSEFLKGLMDPEVKSEEIPLKSIGELNTEYFGLANKHLNTLMARSGFAIAQDLTRAQQCDLTRAVVKSWVTFTKKEIKK